MYPQFSEAFLLKGIIHNKLNQSAEALKCIDKSIKSNPDNYYAYNERGNTWLDLKNYVKAINDYDKALSINSGFAYAYYNRGLANKELAQDDLALEDFGTAISLHPDCFAAYSELGFLYLKSENWQKAYEIFHKGILQAHRHFEPEGKFGAFVDSFTSIEKPTDDYQNAKASIKFFIEGETINEIASKYCTNCSKDEYRDLIFEIQNNLPYIYNGWAFLLSRCPDDEFYDPEAGVRLSIKALSFYGKDDFVHTLAGAYAGSGDYENAEQILIALIKNNHSKKLELAKELHCITQKIPPRRCW